MSVVIAAPRRSGSLALSSARAALAAMPARRRLQVALAAIWLVDAGLQYQPFMFRPAFVDQVLVPATSGAPELVARPALWADHLMLHHITTYDAGFATIQLLIAAALMWRRTVRIGLAVSVAWALGIWWLAEGIGGVTNGASPVAGAPGAAVLYALVALLVWPRRGDDDAVASPAAPSVAESGPLGPTVPKLAWLALWGGLIALGLEAANRGPSALHAALVGVEAGEPGWVQALDRGMAAPLAHHGTEVSVALAILYAVAGLGVMVPGLRRPALVVAVVVGVAFWLAEDFGGVLTGSATDVNSGPLIVLCAATLWPLRRAAALRPGV